MNTDRTDSAWFRKHPDRNFRVRRAAAGEIEEIYRRSIPGAGHAIAANGLPNGHSRASRWR